MHSLQEWLNGQLTGLGLTAEMAGIVDNLILLLCVFLVAFLIDYVCRKILLGTFSRIAKRTKNDWDDLILERRIIHRIIRIVPAVFFYIMLPFAFDNTGDAGVLSILQRICMVYIIAVSLRFITASLNLVNDIYNRKALSQNKPPIKGFIQVVQVIVVFIGIIIIIATLIAKSPEQPG